MSGTYIELGGFNPAGYNLPVDSRLTLHKSEMVTVGKIGKEEYNTGKLDDGTLISFPKVYFCICFETGGLYLYNTENPWEPEFGKFRLISGGGTSVIPNPPDEPTQGLTKLKISDTTYRLEHELLKYGESAPTLTTEGKDGQLYISTKNPGIYQFISTDNSIILADPGTPLPLSLGNIWESVKVVGTEKILSNAYPPTGDFQGERGQLMVDTTACELYQCIGQDITTKKYSWTKISNNRGYTLSLTYTSRIPYKLLLASGEWIIPTNVEQKKFYNVVAIALGNKQSLTTTKGLLSLPYPAIVDEKIGYTLISDAEVNIEGEA